MSHYRKIFYDALPESIEKSASSLIPGKGFSYPGANARTADPYHYYHGGYYGAQSCECRRSGEVLDMWRMIGRFKAGVLLAALLGALAGLVVTWVQRPVYRAHLSLEIQDVNQDFMDIKHLSPVSEGQGSSGLSDIETQTRLLQSDNLNDLVLSKLKGHERNGAFGTKDGLVSVIRGGLRVRVDGQSRIIDVFYDAYNPQFAATFVNTLAQEFIESNMEARWKMSRRTGEWLSRQLEEMRKTLEESDNRLQSYARNTGLMFTSETTNTAGEKLQQLQEELSKAQAARVAAQSQWEVAQTTPPEMLPEALLNASFRALQDKVTELRRERAQLLIVYTEKHNKVMQIDAQIAPIEEALKTERLAMIERLRINYQTALRRETLLAGYYESQSHLVNTQAEKAIHYNVLKREVDSNRQIYETMLQHVKDADIASALRTSNVRLVDAARPPDVPYKPNRTVNCSLGMFSGLSLCAALLIVRARADRTVQAPGEVRAWLDVPELEVIPSLSKEQSRSPLVGSTRKPRAAGPPEPPNPKYKLSAVAESFQALRSSLLFSGENGQYPQVVVLTSAGPREGKTVITSNLAMALAAIKRKVLIIDADLRKPRMHEIFELANTGGLSTLLRDANALCGDLNAILQATAVQGLWVLTSGPGVENPADLLHSPRLAELLRNVKRNYDFVIIDTPPMLTMPDARIVGRLSDGVILVIRAAQTTRDAAEAARQYFSGDRTPVLGTILNDWNPSKNSRGSERYYNWNNGAS